MTNLSVPSSAALCNITVSSDVLQRDIVFAIVLKLITDTSSAATSKQVTVHTETKTKNVLKMVVGPPHHHNAPHHHQGGGSSSSTGGFTQRNAILRSLAGPALHGAMDQAPYYLLGGYYSIASSVHGRSSNASIQLAKVHNYMSIANDIRITKGSSNSDDNDPSLSSLLHQLNQQLTKSSYLIHSSVCTLADMDLAVVFSEFSIDLTNYKSIQRWQRQVLATLQQYATDTTGSDGSASMSNIEIPLTWNFSSSASNTIATKPPVFFYGTEDVDAFISTLYKDNTTTMTTDNTATGPPKKEGKSKAEGKQDNQQQPGDSANNKKGKNKQQQPQASSDKKKEETAATSNNEEYDISALDIRVGKIIKIWEHPDAEKLYCEEIDLGNGEIRKIASGLRPYYTNPNEELLNQHVIVLCNLKSRNLVGFPSHGMVLCASNSDHTAVEIVTPGGDDDSTIVLGERIVFDGYVGEPEPENKIVKKKIFEKVAPYLMTNDIGQVTYKNAVAKTMNHHVIIKAKKNMSNAKVS